MNDFFKRLISKPITMERFNLDNFQDLGDVKIVIKETDGILQKGIHVLCYKNWIESVFKNLELLRLKYIQTNEDKYLDAILGVLPNSFKDFTFENQLRLQAENQELKKENEELEKIRSGQVKIMESDLTRIEKLKKENEQLKIVCDFNCPVHKLATHNACLTCPAVRNSPHHDLKNVTDEELQKIIEDAEAEMEM